MKTMRVMEAKQCAICERTLLVGEQPLRFAPDGMDEYVEVCALCQEIALDHGWVREGSPLGPAVRPARRRRPLSLASIFGDKRRPAAETIVAEPVLRRLSTVEQTIARGRRALQRERRASAPSTGSRAASASRRSSIVVLSGPNPEVVITLAWDISWYQYRVIAGRARSRCGWPSGASSRASSTRSSRTGTRISSLGQGFSRISRTPL